MDTMIACALAEANKDQDSMVFDWIKAAKLIRESDAKYAEAGLAGDWEYTGGRILEDGKPVSSELTYLFLSSNWAVPLIALDGSVIPCFILASESPGWDSGTYWPPEALAILEAQS